MIVVYLSYFVFSLYFLIMFLILIFSIFKTRKINADSNIFVNVLIPARNEEEHIPVLLKALSKQTYKNFKVIIIDDHSTDNTVNVAKMFCSDNNIFSLISNKIGSQGKKTALTQGLRFCSKGYVLQTDADCIPSHNWIKEMAESAEKSDPTLILAPVLINLSGNNWLQNLQALEMLVIMTITEGTANLKIPMLCNGANIMYNLNWVNSLTDAYNQTLISGDDMFILQHAKKQKLKIKFVRNNNVVVKTNAPNNLRTFINQRKRWASKNKHYNDFEIVFFALLTYLVNFFIVFWMILIIFQQNYFLHFLYLSVIKLIIDTFTALIAAMKYKQYKPLIYIPLLTIIYPFYVSISIVFSFKRNFVWKQRKY